MHGGHRIVQEHHPGIVLFFQTRPRMLVSKDKQRQYRQIALQGMVEPDVLSSKRRSRRNQKDRNRYQLGMVVFAFSQNLAHLENV